MSEASSPEIPYKDLTGHVRKISDLYFAYGTFSEVYKGSYQDARSQRAVAIKVLRGMRISSDLESAILQRLNGEARVWHALKHSNVLEFLGIARGLGSSVALVSPYCANGNITDYLDDCPEANRLRLVLDVARGLQYLHGKDVIHANINGRNILVADDGRAVLCDYGRSKIINHGGFTAGSIRYMAPELILKRGEMPETVDGKDDDFNASELLSKESDVYAFSMVGVEILSGEHPYRKISSESAIPDQVSKGLRPKKEEYRLSKQHESIWDILELCWVQDPTQRPTISSVFQRLSRL